MLDEIPNSPAIEYGGREGGLLVKVKQARELVYLSCAIQGSTTTARTIYYSIPICIHDIA